MDVTSFFLLSNTIWLTLQSLPLLFFPHLLISTLLSPETTATQSATTPTEIYLARTLSLALLTVTLLALFTPASYTLVILTIFHTSTFIYIYQVYTTLQTRIPTWTPTGIVKVDANTTGLVLGLIGYGFLAVLAIGTLVFRGDPARLSKRTGADKRMSGWPFRNSKAYDKKKDRKMGGPAASSSSSSGIELAGLNQKPR